MSKQTFTPQSAMDALLAEERIMRRMIPRLKIAEPVVSVLFQLIIWSFGLATCYFMAVFNLTEDPSYPILQVPGLWELYEQLILGAADPELALMIMIVIGYPVAFVACVFVGLLLKLLIRPSHPKQDDTLPADELEAWNCVIRKADQLIAMTRPEDHLLRWNNLLICLYVIVTLILSFFVVGLHHPDFFGLLVLEIVIGAFHLGLSALTFLFIRLAVLRHEPDSIAESTKANAMRVRSGEERRRKQEQQAQEKAAKIQQGIALFNEGKYEEARKLLKGIQNSTSGDLAAIQLLTDTKLGSAEDGAERAYKLLWDAKELGFRDSKIRQAVDDALDRIKPLVMERSQEQLFAAYTSFLGQYYGSVVYKCKPLMEFGHPDAIALTVVSHLLSDNDPDRYPAWLELLKKAKRRGFDPLYDEIVAEAMTKMEEAVRYNEFAEQQRAKRASQAASTPSYPVSGGIPTWAEPSGWYDFRTGETLYRVNGKIINGNGEEVSAAWWC